MSPKAFLVLAAVTVVTTVAAVFAILGQPAVTTLRFVDQPAFPALRENPDAVGRITLTAPGGHDHAGARDRRPLGRPGALRLPGRPQAGARSGGGARRHASDRAQDGAARALRPAAGRGARRRQGAVPAGPPRDGRRQGAGRGDHRQGTVPPDRHRADRDLPAAPGRGAKLARERRRADRAGGRALARRRDRPARPRRRSDGSRSSAPASPATRRSAPSPATRCSSPVSPRARRSSRTPTSTTSPARCPACAWTTSSRATS